MKHFSYLKPALPRPSTPHAKKCMEQIRGMLELPPSPEKIAELERIPGEDDEEQEAA